MTATGSVDEREAIRAVVRRVLEKESSSQRVRAVMEDPAGHDPSLWRTMADLGWLGLAIPERYGGAGSGSASLGVVLEELGRHVTPSPFLSTVVLGAAAIAAVGREEMRDELLPRIASGKLRIALAGAPVAGQEGPTLRASHGGPVIEGRARFVLDAASADLLLVAAQHDAEPDAVSLFLIPSGTGGLRIRQRASIDMTRRLGEVVFDGVVASEESLLGRPGEGAVVIDWLIDRAAAALAADAAGGAQRVLEMCVEYAKTRVQFGRPIGTFQAIKHRCADMLLLVEASKAAAEDAAARTPLAPGVRNAAAAIAKSYACDAYAKVAGDGIQLHGGIGFTWEHDIHLYFKRAKLDQALFGDPSWHRARLADMLLPNAR